MSNLAICVAMSVCLPPIYSSDKTARNRSKWLKTRFSGVLKMKKNANFDRLTWTTNYDVIIEYIRNLIASSDSSLNFVSDRVLEHVPKIKTDQNMLILKN